MEHTVENAERMQRRRRGQTLAEFALTLPIVLILLFGIIEFGRIFQAWVTLQNSARAAARYASTGNYNQTRYPLDDDPAGEATGLVPCLPPSHASNGRGTKTTFDPNPAVPGDEVEVYQGGTEWLFATWYGGIDCDPANETHQEMRKDIARVLSIMDEARIGAAGLSLEAQTNWGFTGPQDTPLYEVWRRPQPRSDQRSWFNTMICSTRPRLDAPASGTYYSRQTPATVPVESRFVTYLGEEQLLDPSGNLLTTLPRPSCLLNEIPTSDTINAGGTNNAGDPWLDPGGPGDGVSIVVTFNHPLITPLGLADYIPIQARRVAVNESFRASRAVNALNTGSGPGLVPPTAIPTATNTATNTATATNTGTNTPQASATFTASPTQPFSCNLINVSTLSFLNGSRVVFQITNDNVQETALVRVTLGWTKPAGFSNMYLAQMSINNQVHWLGNDPTPPTNSGPGGPGPEPGDVASADRTIFANDGTGPGISNWQAVFGNAPSNLGTYLTASNFTPTEFVFEVPGTTQTCVKQFTAATPTRTPTLSGSVTATRTPTPDCSVSSMRVVFGTFMSFGVVRLDVTNNRNTPAILTGFRINWVLRNPSMRLEQVTIGGSNPADPLSTRVWQAPAGQDASPPTVSPGEGTWLTNFTIDAGSSVSLYLDFGGTSSTLSSAFGAQRADFNGTNFNFSCPGGPSNTVSIISQNTATPLPTAGPSSTPSNTFTPSKTPTITPTTASPTPGPTNTRTNTPLPPPPTSTSTVPPPPTVPGSGPSD